MTSTMQPMVSGNSRRDIADLRHSTPPRMSKPRTTMLEQEALSMKTKKESVIPFRGDGFKYICIEGL